MITRCDKGVQGDPVMRMCGSYWKWVEVLQAREPTHGSKDVSLYLKGNKEPTKKAISFKFNSTVLPFYSLYLVLIIKGI
jgi:hypothetical protein